MKAEDQRIAIAQVCGFYNCRYDPILGWRGQHKDINGFRKPIPDYLNDLNVMHEAVMHLRSKSPLNYVKYVAHLTKIVAKFNSDLEDRFSISSGDAAASQRAEAFLRAIGKWRE